jgi:hypothetical protein
MQTARRKTVHSRVSDYYSLVYCLAARLGALFEAKNSGNSGNTVFLCRARKHRKWEQPRWGGRSLKVIYPGGGCPDPESAPIFCREPKSATRCRFARTYSIRPSRARRQLRVDPGKEMGQHSRGRAAPRRHRRADCLKTGATTIPRRLRRPLPERSSDQERVGGLTTPEKKSPTPAILNCFRRPSTV